MYFMKTGDHHRISVLLLRQCYREIAHEGDVLQPGGCGQQITSINAMVIHETVI